MRFRIAVALILGCLAATANADPRAKLLSSYEWDVPGSSWFGGISGMDLSADGESMIAVTDRGTLVQGRIDRGRNGIYGVTALIAQKLNGAEWLTDSLVVDSEGIVLRADGSFCVSFEGSSLVGCYGSSDRLPTVLPAHADFGKLFHNSTLEALAMDPKGRLITIPEDAQKGAAHHTVYRWQQGRWHRWFSFAYRDGFLPVGADFGPDGRLYVLERAAGVFGFRSRVRSWRVERDRADDEQTHLSTPALKHSNLEALSVWRDRQGRIRLTMVSDDNFLPLMRTEIVEYALPALASAHVSQ